MYSERLSGLTRAYKLAQKENASYEQTKLEVDCIKTQLNYVNSIAAGLYMLDAIITQQENDWQGFVLRKLEAEIVQALAFVYPEDGYKISLSARVLRGKIRIEGKTSSYFTASMPGELSDSQGCLFQQIVSFAALIGIMDLVGVNTVYVDEAFSGVAKSNISKITALLRIYQERGYNIILIAQDAEIAEGIEANTLFLSRSIDNKTSVSQYGGAHHE